jgi:uncharacterized protein
MKKQFITKTLSFNTLILLFTIFMCSCQASSKKGDDDRKVIAFFTGKDDMGHVSFVREANKWFSAFAKKEKFTYDSTNNWDNLNNEFLSKYKVVIFLDTRPEGILQRKAFERYMENGGCFIGFHFSAFSLTPSAFPQNWDWYHNKFIGAGEYKGNTWRPTATILRVEDRSHPATRNLPETFSSSPNEWYSWENDLRLNSDIKILLSVDPSGFPLGTGPKLHEIWHTGYYPVVWTNTRYRMLYINMGHNDIDYENKTNRELSHTFTNEIQNRLISDGLLWLLDSK